MGFNEEERQSTPPHGGGRRRRKKKPTASGKSCIMELLNQPGTRKIDAMSRRKYTIRREAGLHLTDLEVPHFFRALPSTCDDLRDFARFKTTVVLSD